MSEILSNIGNFIGSPAGKGVLATAGLGSNIFSGVQNAQATGRYNSAQSYLNNLIQNPTAFNAAAQQYTQPLNQGLVTDITQQTNAQLAERGLGGSSAITQQTLAQALAPYIVQNQQAGTNNLLSVLGMTGSLKPNPTPGTNITQLLASLRGGTATPPAGGTGLAFQQPQNMTPTGGGPGMPFDPGYDYSDATMTELPAAA
jgi:hypothetical protein